jgi:hypothetical protein
MEMLTEKYSAPELDTGNRSNSRSGSRGEDGGCRFSARHPRVLEGKPIPSIQTLEKNRTFKKHTLAASTSEPSLRIAHVSFVQTAIYPAPAVLHSIKPTKAPKYKVPDELVPYEENQTKASSRLKDDSIAGDSSC